MQRNTGEDKVDYSFEYYRSPALAPWEKKIFPPAGTMGIIRFYNFDTDIFLKLAISDACF